MANKSRLSVNIRKHLRSNEHWTAIVTTAQGFCYCCVWAGDQPSEETVRAAWKEDRKAFDPYNCTNTRV